MKPLALLLSLNTYTINISFHTVINNSMNTGKVKKSFLENIRLLGKSLLGRSWHKGLQGGPVRPIDVEEIEVRDIFRVSSTCIIVTIILLHLFINLPYMILTLSLAEIVLASWQTGSMLLILCVCFLLSDVLGMCAESMKASFYYCRNGVYLMCMYVLCTQSLIRVINAGLDASDRRWRASFYSDWDILPTLGYYAKDVVLEWLAWLNAHPWVFAWHVVLYVLLFYAFFPGNTAMIWFRDLSRKFPPLWFWGTVCLLLLTTCMLMYIVLTDETMYIGRRPSFIGLFWNQERSKLIIMYVSSVALIIDLLISKMYKNSGGDVSIIKTALGVTSADAYNHLKKYLQHTYRK
jgi:hypothetical protein